MKTSSSLKNTYAGIASYPDPDLKAQFLRDGARVLRAVGHSLVSHGATITVRTNRGGHAVSGEIYGEIRMSDQPFHLLVQIGSSCCRIRQRTDGVFIMVQRRETIGTGTQTHDVIVGQNVYLNPNENAADLARRIMVFFETTPLRRAA